MLVNCTIKTIKTVILYSFLSMNSFQNYYCNQYCIHILVIYWYSLKGYLNYFCKLSVIYNVNCIENYLQLILLNKWTFFCVVKFNYFLYKDVVLKELICCGHNLHYAISFDRICIISNNIINVFESWISVIS